MKFTIIFLVVLQALDLVQLGPVPKNYVQNTEENLLLLKSGNFLQNIESLGGQYEGDMVLGDQQKRALLGLERTGMTDLNYRWPNGVVPYVLEENVFDDAQVAHIEKGLRAIEEVSCIRFVKHTTEENYVEVTGGDGGCYSEVGNLREGKQNLNLKLFEPDSGCFRLGSIVHEFLHTLGFFHMQSASERDNFVKIEWQHIIAGLEHNFDKYDENFISNFGIEYDVVSVMHYNAYAFTKNGYATIVPNDITLINGMGQYDGMTEKDIQRLNKMYCS